MLEVSVHVLLLLVKISGEGQEPRHPPCPTPEKSLRLSLFISHCLPLCLALFVCLRYPHFCSPSSQIHVFQGCLLEGAPQTPLVSCCSESTAMLFWSAAFSLPKYCVASTSCLGHALLIYLGYTTRLRTPCEQGLCAMIFLSLIKPLMHLLQLRIQALVVLENNLNSEAKRFGPFTPNNWHWATTGRFDCHL